MQMQLKYWIEYPAGCSALEVQVYCVQKGDLEHTAS